MAKKPRKRSIPKETQKQIDLLDLIEREVNGKPLASPYVVDSAAKLAPILYSLKRADVVSLDTETTGLKPRDFSFDMSAEDALLANPDDLFVGFSFALQQGDKVIGWYVPIRHYSAAVLAEHEFRQLLDAILAVPKIYMHNAAFENRVLGNYYREPVWNTRGLNILDTLVEIHTLFQAENESNISLGLKNLVLKLFNYKMRDFPKEWEGPNILRAPMDQISSYAIDDAIGTFWLGTWAETETALAGTDKFCKEVARPLIHILSDIHYHGVRLDRDKLEEMSESALQDMNEIVELLQSCGGKSLNISSPQQMEVFLYDVLKLPLVHARTKTGQRTTGADAIKDSLHCARLLNFPSETIEIVQAYSDYVALAKLYSSFLKPLYEKSKQSGRVHPTVLQTGATSGRISMRDPNGMNIPSERKSLIRNKFYNVRGVFLPDEGHTFIVRDESGLEMRILAHVTGEPTLIKALHLSKAEGGDPHLATAMQVFSFSHEDWEKWTAIKLDESGKKMLDESGEAIPVDPMAYREANSKRMKAKCFHPDVEVLTPKGWVRIPELDKNTLVLQAVPGDLHVSFEWAYPTEVYTTKHPSGKLVKLTDSWVDTMVTEDHRMLVYNTNSLGPKVMTPMEMKTSTAIVANAGFLEDGVTGHLDSISLCIAAYFNKAYKCVKNDKGTLGLSVAKNVKNFLGLVDRLNLQVKETRDTLVTYYTLNKAASDFIYDTLGEEKHLPWSWLSYDINTRKFILDQLREWRGRKAVHTNAYTIIYLRDKISADVVLALAATSGLKCFIQESEHEVGTWEAHILNTDLSKTRHLVKEVVEFTDEVACLSVPSSFVLTRFNGLPMVTGQTINFGTIYGMGPAKLASSLGCTLDEAKMFISLFFEKMPYVSRWFSDMEKTIKDTGKIKTILGRIRRTQLHKSHDSGIVAGAIRSLRNANIQGSAFDVVASAMVKIQAHPEFQAVGAKMLLQVHDELVITTPIEHAERIDQIVAFYMQNPFDGWHLKVPLMTDGGITNSWSH